MWEQPVLMFDSETDLHGIWESIPMDQRQEFIVVCAMLLVEVAIKSPAHAQGSEHE